MDDKLLSFETYPFVEIEAEGDQEPVEGSIWDNLKDAIRKVVKQHGIKDEAVLPGQTKLGVLEDAIEDIYHDVANPYYWYFNSDDDRANFLTYQKRVNIPLALSETVEKTVQDNLKEMRLVGQIPAGEDGDSLDNIMTDDLSRYILNWEDWYYDRKIDDDIEDYREGQSSYEDIYINSDYGDLSNLLNTEVWDDLDNEPHT